MVKHNNQIPNGHFHKKWQQMVKTWFDQPGRKLRRRTARARKAAQIAPRPVEGLFRPAVRCQTQKYHTRLRAGRGFTLEELKAAGVRRKEARTIGIAVDHRRRNRSAESLDMNVKRLQNYKARLIVFPRKAGKVKKGDSDAATVATATQLKGPIAPIVQDKPVVEFAKIKDADKKQRIFFTQRRLRADVRMAGVRAKKAAEKAANEALSKKAE